MLPRILQPVPSPRSATLLEDAGDATESCRFVALIVVLFLMYVSLPVWCRLEIHLTISSVGVVKSD